jgi:crotonobetainyl-CoA:carnitine CoA-transferase CaiB-like acyl-CoA transferase
MTQGTMTMKNKNGPLAGVKVVELAHMLAGPTCGLMLADMGADVIKVEKVPGGDDTRRMEPPSIGGESSAFLMMNRNKRGIAVDLKKESGKALLRRLLKSSDVVTENYRKGTMERLGLGYDSLRADNPALIYGEISGFGRTGPYADRAGFDLIAQGMTGLMSITGEGPGRPPVKCGATLIDITAGILLAMGILGAYVNRLKTGEGQKVDTSLFEAGITQTYWQSAIALATGIAPGPLGSGHPLNAPYQAFQTADGWMNIGAPNQANWLRLVEAMGAPELAEDARFRTNPDRMTNLDALVDALTTRFTERPTADWLGILEKAGVPAGPVLDMNQVLADPQTRAREMVVETAHSTAGPVKSIGMPVKFSETPGDVLNPAPAYGEHTRDVLRELDYEEPEIDALIAEETIVAA